MYKPFRLFIYRTPAYPFTRLLEYLVVPDTVFSLFKDEYIKETIYIASPVLCREIQKLADGKIKNKTERDKIVISFIKYFSRMGTRCTPFGLFATCSPGELAEITQAQIEDPIRKCTRLDMYYLCTLVQYISNLKDVKEQLRFFPNNTIYELKNQLRYIEYKYQNFRRMHTISTVEKSKFLNAILKKAARGVLPDEIREYLKSEDINEEDVITYTDDLIRSQLLVSEIDVVITGRAYFDKIIGTLQKMKLLGDSKGLLDSLCEVNELLKQIDSVENGTSLSYYDKIAEQISKHPVSFQENAIFQVDATRKGTVKIGKHVIEELQSVISYFCKTSPAGGNSSLSNFQRAFYERYEDQEIPLSIALDSDLGIGYPAGNGFADISPILHKLALPIKDDRSASQIANNIQTFLLKKLLKMQQEGANEIVLYPEEFKDRTQNIAKLPSTLFVFFQLIKDSANDLLLDIKGISCSAATVISRFAHLDPKIHELIMEITRKESEMETRGIVAEIVHLPSSRTGNILSRPHLRDHELVYLAHSDLPESNKIFISDLMLSSKSGKLYIRSKKLNKLIFPRLTSAHNYHNDTLPVYRFLCDMQYQDTRSGFHFNWGGLENSLDYRPRVRYGSSILSLASWSVTRNEIKNLLDLKDSDLLNQVGEWRAKRKIPELTSLADGDNELFVDFNSCLSIYALFSVVKKRDAFVLKEFLFSPDALVMKGNNGDYLNECIVPFYKDEK